jgi:hypothetical protein
VQIVHTLLSVNETVEKLVHGARILLPRPEIKISFEVGARNERETLKLFPGRA